MIKNEKKRRVGGWREVFAGGFLAGGFDDEIYILAVMLLRIPRREYCTHYITVHFICGTSPASSSYLPSM